MPVRPKAMATDKKDEPSADRYRRARDNVPAILFSRLTGSGVSGYWVTPDTYFFLAERFEAVRQTITEVPMIAQASSGAIRPVLEPGAIVSLLSEAGIALAMEDLDDATYDMPQADRLVVSVGKTAHLFDVEHRSHLSTSTGANVPEIYSPDGTSAVYVEGDNLWLRDRSTNACRPLTEDGAPLNPYGQQPENWLTTLSYRKSRYPVGVWSPDSQWLLTHRCDERDLPDAHIVQNAPGAGKPPVLHRLKMSLVGEPLPSITLVAIHIATGRKVEATPLPMNLFSPAAFRQAWFIDGERFCYLRSDRFHTLFELIEVDLNTGTERALVTEKADQGYLDPHPLIFPQPNIRTLASTDEVIWYSERDGWGHLYLYDAGAAVAKTQITRGQWQVRDIVHVDETRRRILFLAGGVDPSVDSGLRRLCSASLDGGEVVTLLAHEGDLGVRAEPLGPFDQDRPYRPAVAPVGANKEGRYVVVRRSSLGGGSQTLIADLESGREFPIAQTDAALIPPVPPRLFDVVAADGATKLHGALFLPADFKEDGRYPIIDYIYPGPQVPWLPRTFATHVGAQAQALAELGAIVLIVDSRGVPFRSRAFHQAGYGNMLEPQLADHAATIQQLCDRHEFIDRLRVGIIGSSGGGLAAARAMLDYPHVFHVGISICGNHNSRHYRSIWMDRYVGPDNTAERHFSAPFAQQLQGKLLLIAADMDENVLSSQLFEFAAALIEADKDFEMLIVPNEGHALQITSAYAQRRIWDYFTVNLIGSQPPGGFSLKYGSAALARMGKVIARNAQW